MQPLTRIQQAVYDYTRQAVRQGRPFPSLREIASRFGFQHTTARFHLKALEKKGYIEQRRQRVSDYMLAGEDGISPPAFDLVAKIPAGAPLPVFDEGRDSFTLDAEFFGGGDIIAIRVSGDSMAGDANAMGPSSSIICAPSTRPCRPLPYTAATERSAAGGRCSRW